MLFTTLRVNSPSFSDRIVPLFDTILEPGAPTEPHHTPSPEADTSHPTTLSIPLPSIPTAPIPPVTQPDTTLIRQYLRRAKIAKSYTLPTVVDEPASPVRDVSEGEACPTEYGFIADQDRATIAKTSTLPHDSAPRVTSPAADEGNMQHTIYELTALYEPASPVRDDSQGEACPTDSGFIADQDRATIAKSSTLPRDSAPRVTSPAAEEGNLEMMPPIKGRSNNEWEEAAERISNDSEEIVKVLTSMDVATVLAGETNVPTGSGFIPTAGPPATVISTGSKVGPTACPIVRRRKGKEVMVESDTPKKKKLQEQIDAQVARELEEQQEREDMRMNEQMARDAE
nr:hypothetical protein [Tanacetum cinerariifolium]